MARALTKPDLLKAAEEQFEKMWKLIDSLTAQEQTAAFHFENTLAKKEAHWKRDNNLRDVLVHLYEWHQLLLMWVEANQKGEETPFLPPPYNWKTYGQMNVHFWEKHQATPYEEAKNLLLGSHKKVVALMESFSNEELFSKNQFTWANTSPLGAYCVSATASHYNWAIKKIKAHITSLQNTQKR